MAIVQNYTIYKNSDFEVAAIWDDSDGNAYILSDGELKIRRKDTDAELVSLTSGDGITLDLVDGWATVVVSEAKWVGVDYTGTAYYDLKVTRNSDSRTKILLKGDLVIKQGVTR